MKINTPEGDRPNISESVATPTAFRVGRKWNSSLWLGSVCVWIELYQSALGHPGHETLPVQNDSLMHYLFEPAHGLIYGIVAIISVACCVLIGKRYARNRMK